MNSNKTLMALVLILCLITVIPATLYFWKLPAAELLPSEKELINFTSTPVALSKPKQQPLFSGLECPVKATSKLPIPSTGQITVVTKVPPPLSGQDANPARTASKKMQPGSLSSLPTISMIYSEGDTNVAIIGGNILREGSSFGTYHVLKIEKSRVLIKSAGKNIWLNME